MPQVEAEAQQPELPKRAVLQTRGPGVRQQVYQRGCGEDPEHEAVRQLHGRHVRPQQVAQEQRAGEHRPTSDPRHQNASNGTSR
jgi:hypothetical protein